METEDAAGLLLRLEGGARAVATISQVSAGRKNLLLVRGRRLRAARWPGTSERPEELWLGHRGRPNELLLRDATLMHGAAAATTHLPAGHAEGFADTFRELYRAVYARRRRRRAAGSSPTTRRSPTATRRR